MLVTCPSSVPPGTDNDHNTTAQALPVLLAGGSGSPRVRAVGETARASGAAS